MKPAIILANLESLAELAVVWAVDPLATEEASLMEVVLVATDDVLEVEF